MTDDKWHLPPYDTPCYDHNLAAVLTLGELLAQVMPDQVPATRKEYEEFLELFGIEPLVTDEDVGAGMGDDFGAGVR